MFHAWPVPPSHGAHQCTHTLDTFGYLWIPLEHVCRPHFWTEPRNSLVRRRRVFTISCVAKLSLYAFAITDISWHLQCFSHVHSCLSFWMFLMRFTFLKLTVPAFQQFQHVEKDLFRPIRFSNDSEALFCAQGWSQQLATARSGW